MRTKKQNDNLLLLADFLEKVPRKRFDFTAWVGSDWEGKPDLSCGVVACGLGWGTTIPALRKQGLRLVENKFGGACPVLREDAQRVKDGTSFTDDWNLIVRACTKLFGLSDREVEYLFTPGDLWDNEGDERLPDEATPKQLAKHIRKFVKRGGMPRSHTFGSRPEPTPWP